MRKLGKSGKQAESSLNQIYYILVLAHTDHILYCLPKSNSLLVKLLSIKITPIHLDGSHNPRHYPELFPLPLSPHPTVTHTHTSTALVSIINLS